MTTTSKYAIEETIQARLRDYSFGGTTIGTLTSNRVIIDWAPDNTQFPCVVMRIIDWQSDASLSNMAVTFDVEVMVYGRGRTPSTVSTVKQIADLAEQALLTWKESSATLGLTFGQFSQRDTVPPPPEPADREVFAERVLVTCQSFPRYITDALTS